MKKTFSYLAVLLLAAGVYSPAQTAGQEQLQKRVEQLEKELQDLKSQIATLPSADATKPAAAAAQEPSESTQALQADVDQKAGKPKSSINIYGAAQLDLGYDAGANDPNWFDVMRTTKLPAFADQFGKGGRTYSGVRQSRFGVKTSTPTGWGDLKTIFEFELFGVGVDAGQTTFRLRHAWGEIGPIGGGQTWSPFMDPDVFPNSLEYWGPAGMVFFRNVQFRVTPYRRGKTEFALALERPGASADPGSLAGRIEIQNTQARFPAPDFSSHFRWGGERGHFQVATMLRYIKWDDLLPADAIDTSGSAIGWGVNTSGNYIFNNKKDTARLQVVYGHGIQNYMNDSPVDIAPVLTGNPTRPIDGEALAELGVVAFLDHTWSDRWSTSVGYSLNRVDNTGLQDPSAFHRGHYALFNFMFYPAKNVMTGAEFQWGRRENRSDGFTYDDYRIQFGAKYNFSWDIFGGGNK